MPGPYYIARKGVAETRTSLLGISVDSDGYGYTGTNNILTNVNALERVRPLKTVIDVVKDFVWTASPSYKTHTKIPTIYLTELEQIQNSLVSSALYYLNAITTSNITSNAATYIVNKLTERASSGGFFGGVAGIAAERATSLGGIAGTISRGTGIESLLKGFANTVDKFVSAGVDKSILTDYLKSYIGIYLTEATGFQYALPYFGDVSYNVANNWQSDIQVKPFLDPTAKAKDWIDQAAATLNILQPGTYVERPKYFHYPTEGDSITVRFPLINTTQKNGDIVPYQQNYELIWLLAFQNKPYRTSFSRILPPKIYTLSIPGMKFFPYCYIRDMSVNFLGTRRKLDVNLPIPSNTVIQAPIPEAYDISITFTSLLADTGNLMISQGFSNKINVKTT